MKPYLVIPLGIMLAIPLAVSGKERPSSLPLPDTIIIAKQSVASALSSESKSATTYNVLINRAAIDAGTASNLTELLVEQGIAAEVAPTDYDENVILLRGFATEHLNTEANGSVLILIDGRRSGVASARQIALDSIERIEIVRGAQMYKYAMSSPGGIINIITRKGGLTPVSGKVYTGFGSYSAWKAGATVGGDINDFDYSLGYSHSVVDDDYKAGNHQRVFNTSTNGVSSAFANLGYTFASNHRVGLDSYFHKVDKAYRPAYIDDDGDAIPPGYTDRESKIFNINYAGSTTAQDLSWHSSMGFSEDTYETYSGAKYPKAQEAKTYQAQLGLTYQRNNYEISSGLDFVNYQIKNGGSSDSYYYKKTDWPVALHSTTSTRTIGAYVLGVLHFIDDRLSVTGGLRYESTRANDKAVGDEEWDKYSYFNGLSRDQFPKKRTFNHLSPSLGSSFMVTDWLKLRADYTQSWRAPSGRQLFASRRTEGYGAGGDPRLNPERTHAYEVGFDIDLEDFNLSTTYFFHDIKDYIYLYYYTDPAKPTEKGGRVMRNVEKRYQAGIELQTSANLAGLAGYDSFTFKPFLNLTHMTKREEILDRDADYLEGRWWPIVRMPDTVVNYGVLFKHHRSDFSANLNFAYSGLRLPGRANATPTGNYRDDEFGKINVANLSLRKRLWQFPNKNQLVVKADINNLFNKVYSYRDKVGTTSRDTTYPFQGRNYYATLEYVF